MCCSRLPLACPQSMKLLIVVDGVRHEVVAAGSYTVAELLQRMGSTCLSGSVDGVLSLGNLILPADGSPLLSFLSRRHMYSLIASLHGVRHNAVRRQRRRPGPPRPHHECVADSAWQGDIVCGTHAFTAPNVSGWDVALR